MLYVSVAQRHILKKQMLNLLLASNSFQRVHIAFSELTRKCSMDLWLSN